MNNIAELQQKSHDELIQFILSKQQTIDYLYEQIRLLKQGKFGASSEKYTDNDPQGRLFDEGIEPINEKEIAEADEEITIPMHTRKKGRHPLPKELTREQVIYDLTEAERT